MCVCIYIYNLEFLFKHNIDVIIIFLNSDFYFFFYDYFVSKMLNISVIRMFLSVTDLQKMLACVQEGVQ